MLYFAYGSNMLKERICHPRRVPGAQWVQAGYVTGRKLAFHKRSWDGSGKCDIPLSSNPSDRVYGVVYHVPKEEVAALDRAEALGAGYRRERIEVLSDEGPFLFADAYLADPQFIESSLLPYTWYKELVLRGAQQNGFQQSVLEEIAGVPAVPDPDPTRITAIEAAEALQEMSSSTFPC